MQYRILVYLSFFLLVSLNSYAAKEKKYVVEQINEKLLKNATSVVRLSDYQYTIIDKGKMKLKCTYAITILNSRADDLASFYLPYDKFRNINGLNACIYNKEGEEVRKVKNSEINDLNLATGQSGSLTDGRIKFYEAKNSDYPFTFEYEYEMDYATTFFFPNWHPVSSYNQSIEKDIFSIVVPEGIEFIYEELNVINPLQIKKEKGDKVYHWSLENFLALKEEPHSPLLSEFTPYVYTRSKLFEMDGYEGSTESWKTIGDWVVELNKGRNTLPEETIIKLNELVKDCKTVEEKVKKLYEYLQSKSRYISIQLGIGGWQTADACEVDDKGYGDCKGLSNYMNALLNAVGIESNYVLINAGRYTKDVKEDFPKSQFNHAILMVPNQKDTIWLECTSQRNPFGYLGAFTGNRHALVIQESESRLVKTRYYSEDENNLSNNLETAINSDGSAEVKIGSEYKGMRYETLGSLYYESKEEQEKYLYKTVDFNDFKINSYNIELKPNELPEAHLTMDVSINDYSVQMEDNLFVPLNLYNRSTYVPKKVRNRKTKVVLKNAYTEMDKNEFQLPEGFELKNIPEPIHISSEFGDYDSKVQIDGNKVKYNRKLVRKRGNYPKESYPKLIEFYKDVKSADNNKMVLVKKGS